MSSISRLTSFHLAVRRFSTLFTAQYHWLNVNSKVQTNQQCAVHKRGAGQVAPAPLPASDALVARQISTGNLARHLAQEPVQNAWHQHL